MTDTSCLLGWPKRFQERVEQGLRQEELQVEPKQPPLCYSQCELLKDSPWQSRQFPPAGKEGASVSDKLTHNEVMKVRVPSTHLRLSV